MLFAELFPVVIVVSLVLLAEGRNMEEKGGGVRFKDGGREAGKVHGHINILHRHLAVNGLHGSAGVLHGSKGFLVDVCGFDGVDLLFEHGYLAICLLEGVFVLLLAFERGAGGWWGGVLALALHTFGRSSSNFFIASKACIHSRSGRWSLGDGGPAYLFYS